MEILQGAVSVPPVAPRIDAVFEGCKGYGPGRRRRLLQYLGFLAENQCKHYLGRQTPPAPG